MSEPSLIVCERQGRWAAALGRAIAARNPARRPTVVEVRSAVELQERIAEDRRCGKPGGMVVVELLAAEAERACSLAAWCVRWGNDAPTAVVTEDGGDYEWQARAAGADLFASSLRAVQPLVDAYMAFVADAPHRLAVVEQDQRTPTEQIWDALPWPTK